jgi:hypothetical protein
VTSLDLIFMPLPAEPPTQPAFDPAACQDLWAQVHALKAANTSDGACGSMTAANDAAGSCPDADTVVMCVQVRQTSTARGGPC